VTIKSDAKGKKGTDQQKRNIMYNKSQYCTDVLTKIRLQNNT